jgi:hypothetical protein
MALMFGVEILTSFIEFLMMSMAIGLPEGLSIPIPSNLKPF